MGLSLIDSLSIALLPLTALSFVPQLARFWTGRGVRDVSVFYVLFHLVSATEQVTLLLLVNVLFVDDADFGRARVLSDWLIFAQGAVVFALFYVFFLLTLVRSSSHLAAKVAAALLFLLVLLVTLVPAVAMRLTCPRRDGRPVSDLGTDLFINGHRIVANPVVSVLAVLPLFFQIDRAGALSPTGLLAHAVVFAAAAALWPWRLHFDADDGGGASWYPLKGWATVDNAILAAVQFLLFLARNGWRGKEDELEEEEGEEGEESGYSDEDHGEREPLLRGGRARAVVQEPQASF